MNLGVRIWRDSEQTTEIATRSVFIEPGGNSKTPMPDAVREKLEGFSIDW
jgi:acyl-CoA thioesterase FadM